MFDIVYVHLYHKYDANAPINEFCGRLLRNDRNCYEAFFVPDDKDLSDGFTVSGAEGVSMRNNVWFTKPARQHDIMEAIREELKEKYEDYAREMEYYRNQYLEFGGRFNNEEVDAE